MTLADLAAAMEVDAESLEQPWSEGIWRKELKSPFGYYLALEEEGVIIGQIGVRRAGNELHITTLAIRPEKRRRGYARALIKAALDAHPDVWRVRLEVRPSNTAARALYTSLGFVTIGRRYRYYGNEDALVMTLDL